MNSKPSKKKVKKNKKRDVRNKLRLPLFQLLSQNDIRIKSFNGTTESLFNAIKQSWEMCSHCGQFFTLLEAQKIQNGFCPSNECQKSFRRYEPVALPIDRITVYAQMLASENFTESLIYYLFYEIDDCKIRENAKLFETEEERINKIENAAPVVMESWRKTGLVWVKRGHKGKFLTWSQQ